ncbi:MAG: hypothetical protein VYB47_00835, partial [Candidatus Thermoplasmatota archaeon]|nr:hypothetical protein [Candidatus Thermoplasmatota archaeon]
AIVTRSRAINILVFFVFCIFISLPNISLENPLFSLSVNARARCARNCPIGSLGWFFEVRLTTVL